MEKMRVKANGTELEVNYYPRNGETIVFIHFSGGNLSQWNGIVPYFQDKYQILTLDLRGHGKSDKAENGYTIDNMAMDVICIMNQLGINKAHIVGSSLGGEIAASLAAHFPERIQSIVAEGAIQSYFGENGVCNIPEEEIPYKKMKMRERRAKIIATVFDSIAKRIEIEKQEFSKQGVSWNKQIEEFIIYDSIETEDGKYTYACPKCVMEKYLEDYWDVKFEKYFEKIICPVLMLPSEEEWESQDIKASIEGFQKFLKVSQVEVISGGCHAYVAFQYPLEFCKVIQRFYNDIER
jgi:2-succinyl-6-hydroxy-2,4-cyclohexadiene-1-carboxylate synthase